MKRRFLCEAGLTLVEMAVVLAALLVLAGVLAPAGLDMLQQARELQVQRDCDAIRDSLVRLLIDNGQIIIRSKGGRGPRVQLLVGDGGIPPVSDRGDARWTAVVAPDGTIDLLDRYLVTNDPGGNPGYGWPAPKRADGPGWRGAYVRGGIGLDPWGSRYGVNVGFLGTRQDVIVLSAGPNGVIETPYAGQGIRAGGDDRIVLVR
jgi:type II secretory pathway pseudopilin PulG